MYAIFGYANIFTKYIKCMSHINIIISNGSPLDNPYMSYNNNFQ